jgi:hypothetical protein
MQKDSMTSFELHIRALLDRFGTAALRKEWESIQVRGNRHEMVLFNARLED